jgi:hypothetical protein
MNTKVKATGKLYRVQKVTRNGNGKALHELTMPSGKKVVTMRKGTFLSAKDAAAKALAKQKVPA